MPTPKPIVIHPPVVEERGEFTRASFPIQGLDIDTLWFDVSAEFGHFIDDGCDAALMALLALGLASGRPLKVEGPVSERLLWGLRHTVLPVTPRVLPFLGPARLDAAELRNGESPGGDAVVTGLSCGVDSFSLLLDHLVDGERIPSFTPTHLLFAHIGHHGYGNDIDQRVEVRWQKARSAARELGRPLFRVFSNTPDFYPDRYDDTLRWVSIMTLRICSVPLLLQRGVHRYLLASSHSFGELRVEPYPLLSVVEPVLLPALGSERMDIVSVGSEYTRVEKTARIADWEVARRHLDVCIMEGTNCSRCVKCLRTLLTLEALGRLDDFRDVFDLDVYAAHRIENLAQTLAEETDSFLLEIRDFLRQRNFPIPPAARARAAAIRAWRLLPNGARRGIRTVARAALGKAGVR